MGQTICIANPKGGVGKTTTAVNLSTAMAMAEKMTLLVDSDPQGHATTGLGIDKTRLSRTLYQAMIGKTSMTRTVMDTHLDFLKVLPTGVDLYQAETDLMTRVDRETVLRSRLKELRGFYDYIIIDSPPSLGFLSKNAMAASDALLIPLQCEFYALEVMGHMLKAIRDLATRNKLRLRINGILLTMFDPNENICRQIADAARDHFDGLVYETVIPRNTDLRESASYGRPLLLRNLLSPGAKGYLDLAREIWRRKKMEAMGPDESESKRDQYDVS